MLVKERTLWVDSCRFFAIFVIMGTHFLAEFRPDALMLWEQGLSSWLLYGLTGKFSVAFFFVLLGYFASRPAKFSAADILRYSFRRYAQFAFYIFVCTLIYIAATYCTTWLFHCPNEQVLRLISDGFRYNLVYLARDAFLFEDNYNATLWCMQQLFLASIICRTLAYVPEKLGFLPKLIFGLAVAFLLMLLDGKYCVWLAAAVLGYVLRVLLENNKLLNKLSSPTMLTITAVLSLLLIKLRMPEGVLQYSLQSIAALLLIFIQFNLPWAQRLLASKPLPWLGSISMGLFVVHTPINSILASSLYPLLSHIMVPGAAQLICFVISTGLCIFCAWLLHRMHSFVTKK